MGRMSFAEINAAADEDKRTHHQRHAAMTRAHFERHPECRRVILKMDDDGNVIRGKGEINVEARCRPGWFTEWMARSRRDEQRPMECLNAEPGGSTYRLVVEPRGKKEQHLPDRDYGTVDMPRWLQEQYMPLLHEAYFNHFAEWSRP